MKTVPIAGKVTLNGAAPVNGPDCLGSPTADKARVSLSETSTGASFILPISCESSGFAFS